MDTILIGTFFGVASNASNTLFASGNTQGMGSARNYY
jgi:hypothetical protein